MSKAWPEKRVDELRKLVRAKHSAAEIAIIMGLVSKNAAIGAIHRHVLGKQYKRKARPRVRTKPRFSHITGLFGSAPQALKAAPYVQQKYPDEPKSLNVALVDLEPAQCRWAHGDGPFFFCGQPIQEGSSYCAHHHARCFTKTDSIFIPGVGRVSLEKAA